MNVSDLMEERIRDVLAKQEWQHFSLKDSPFELLLGLGELIDRLSIVNIKLFDVKNAQDYAVAPDMVDYLTKQDLALVKERSRLKECIDEKILAICKRVIDGEKDGGLNPEVKRYSQ